MTTSSSRLKSVVVGVRSAPGGAMVSAVQVRGTGMRARSPIRILLLALVALAACTVPAQAADRDRVPPAILADEELPIGLWWPPPPAGDPVVVGRFRAPSRGDGRSLMVVNRSSQAAGTTTLRLPPPVRLADALAPGGAAVTQRRVPGGTEVKLALPAGGAALLELERGRPR
jgi:hypothetical protein